MRELPPGSLHLFGLLSAPLLSFSLGEVGSEARGDCGVTEGALGVKTELLASSLSLDAIVQVWKVTCALQTEPSASNQVGPHAHAFFKPELPICDNYYFYS